MGTKRQIRPDTVPGCLCFQLLKMVGPQTPRLSSFVFRLSLRRSEMHRCTLVRCTPSETRPSSYRPSCMSPGHYLSPGDACPDGQISPSLRRSVGHTQRYRQNLPSSLFPLPSSPSHAVTWTNRSSCIPPATHSAKQISCGAAEPNDDYQYCGNVVGRSASIPLEDRRVQLKANTKQIV